MGAFGGFVSGAFVTPLWGRLWVTSDRNNHVTDVTMHWIAKKHKSYPDVGHQMGSSSGCYEYRLQLTND